MAISLDYPVTSDNFSLSKINENNLKVENAVNANELEISAVNNDLTSQLAEIVTEKATKVEVGVERARIDLLKTSAGDYYIKCLSTDTGALFVVASGATTGQINIASVTPRLNTYTPVASDYVRLVSNGLTAETIDIRVGADATLYDTAGDAVREQTLNLKSHIKNIGVNGSNIFNKDELTSDTAIDKTYGHTYSQAGWKCTDYILVTSGASMYLKHVNNTLYAFYDGSKKIITTHSYYGGNLPSPFTVPTGAVYARFSIQDALVERGAYVSTVDYFEPYGVYPSSYFYPNKAFIDNLFPTDIRGQAELETKGYMNLFDIDKFMSKHTVVTIDDGRIILNGLAWTGGIYYKFNLKKNTDYVLSFTTTLTSGIAGIQFYASDNATMIKEVITTGNVKSIDFNVSDNDTIYIRFIIRQTDCVNFTFGDIDLHLKTYKIKEIENELIQKDVVSCWGDSLTAGAGTTAITINGVLGATMPMVLANLLGYTYSGIYNADASNAVLNFGIGGEDSRTILSRMGAMLMYVNNITIPASGSVQFDTIKSSDGSVIAPCKQPLWWATGWTFDVCSIGGVVGALTYSSSTSKYTFTRSSSGDALVINRPTAIKSQTQERKNDILVLQFGHNGGWNSDVNVLVNQYRSAIEKNGNDRYIIIGDTDGTNESHLDWENALKNAFGRHFINMREYLAAPIYDTNGNIVSCYGLADRGLTPTADDLTKIAVGAVPLQLKVDVTHFNAYGYYTEGEQVYKRGKELGYW